MSQSGPNTVSNDESDAREYSIKVVLFIGLWVQHCNHQLCLLLQQVKPSVHKSARVQAEQPEDIRGKTRNFFFFFFLPENKIQFHLKK